ncbi:MAG: Sua5/YciO/YrdC/YwlC family protein [Pseudomonadota bacterium]
MNLLNLRTAASVVRSGGVIAYPTESCFGLGCDPRNISGIRRILKIKRRMREKGLILIADTASRFRPYVSHYPAEQLDQIFATWPGPNTWLLPAKNATSRWIRGQYDSIAVRVTAHRQAALLCQFSRSAIVSTSANLAGQPSLRTHRAVSRIMGDRIDYIVPGLIGSDEKPSTIRDGFSGELIRV